MDNLKSSTNFNPLFELSKFSQSYVVLKYLSGFNGGIRMSEFIEYAKKQNVNGLNIGGYYRCRKILVDFGLLSHFLDGNFDRMIGITEKGRIFGEKLDELEDFLFE